MIEFKRDKDTGILYAYKDGKPIGPVMTMGDEVRNGSNQSRPKG